MKKNHNKTQRNGFKTPDNYFDNFQKKLNAQLDLEKNADTKTKVIPIFTPNFKYLIYIAASILLLVGITFSINNNVISKKQITLVTDTINTINENLQLSLSNYEREDELLALFVEDEYVDDYLDDYLIEGVILQ